MSESDERKKVRKDMLVSIDAAYIATLAAVRLATKKNEERAKKFQNEIDELTALNRNMADSATKVWNERMNELKLPVEGGAVVPWTKQGTPDELILAIGEDEYWVVYSTKTRHHYGPAIDDSGNRLCLSCAEQHYGTLPKYDLAVIPPDAPENVKAALAALREKP